MRRRLLNVVISRFTAATEPEQVPEGFVDLPDAPVLAAAIAHQLRRFEYTDRTAVSEQPATVVGADLAGYLATCTADDVVIVHVLQSR